MDDYVNYELKLNFHSDALSNKAIARIKVFALVMKDRILSKS